MQPHTEVGFHDDLEGGLQIGSTNLPELWEYSQAPGYSPKVYMGIANETGEQPDPHDKETKGLYAPVSVAFPVDLTTSVATIAAGYAQMQLGFLYPPLIERGLQYGYSGGIALGRSLDKFATYLYSGPLPLLDPNLAFSVPCLDIDLATNLDKFNLGTHGRYGHPFTILTALGLSMPVLPGEKESRQCPPPPTEDPVEICSD